MGYKLRKLRFLDMYIFRNIMNINSLPATVICPVPQWDGLRQGRCRFLKNVLVYEKNIGTFEWNSFVIKITQNVTHIILEKK